MGKEENFTNIEEYTEELKKLSVEKIAFCETNERRVTQNEDGSLEVMPVVKLELLAYKESTLYKCSLSDVDLNSVFEDLESEGFDVTRSSRNII